MLKEPIAPTGPGEKPRSVQPGGGWCMDIELAWGRLRRALAAPLSPRLRADSRPRNVRVTAPTARTTSSTRATSSSPATSAATGSVPRTTLSPIAAGSASPAMASPNVSVHLLFARSRRRCASCWHWRALGLLRCRCVPACSSGWRSSTSSAIPSGTSRPTRSCLSAPPTARSRTSRRWTSPTFRRPGPAHQHLPVDLQRPRQPHASHGPRVGGPLLPGAFLDARNPDSAVRNEQLWMDLEEPGGRVAAASSRSPAAIARRIVCWLQAGRPGGKGRTHRHDQAWLAHRHTLTSDGADADRRQAGRQSSRRRATILVHFIATN